jgi:hypothetical protein
MEPVATRIPLSRWEPLGEGATAAIVRNVFPEFRYKKSESCYGDPSLDESARND